MEACLQNFISAVAYRTRIQLEQYGPLTQENVLWAGSPNYQTRISQDEIDSVPAFAQAQLTTTQLADAVYALEQVRTAITNAMPAMAILAQL